MEKKNSCYTEPEIYKKILKHHLYSYNSLCIMELFEKVFTKPQNIKDSGRQFFNNQINKILCQRHKNFSTELLPPLLFPTQHCVAAVIESPPRVKRGWGDHKHRSYMTF